MMRLLAGILIVLISVAAVGEEPAPLRLKVMTFNIYHGETMKGNFDLDAIAKVIIDADPDMVALQEVDFKTRRAKGMDLATELALRTKMTPVFGAAMPYDGGEYGEAILSKYSFVSTCNVGLPHSVGREPRAALEARVALPDGTIIALVGTHLDHLRDEGDRLKQAQAIIDAFATNEVPTILAGDLNAVPESATMRLLREHWAQTSTMEAEPTSPSKDPKRKIDYVMIAPAERWRVLETRVIQDKIASDHCAYMATLELVGRD